MAEAQIIQYLLERERELGTSAALADKLGIARSVWCRIRNKKRNLCGTVAIAAAKEWPELQGLVSIFLYTELPMRNRRQLQIRNQDCSLSEAS